MILYKHKNFYTVYKGDNRNMIKDIENFSTISQYDPDRGCIQWTELNPLFLFKYKELNHVLFMHHFHFYNKNKELINHFSFIRYQQKNYFYDQDLSISEWLEQNSINTSSIYNRFLFAIRLDNHNCLVLHIVNKLCYMLLGVIDKDIFFTTAEISMSQSLKKQEAINYSGERVKGIDFNYIKFLANIKESHYLLSKLK